MILALKNIYTSYYIYQGAFQETVMKSDMLSISEVHFPGVAICNLNSFKKSALVKMANWMKVNANTTFKETYNSLRILTSLRRFAFVPKKQKKLLSLILIKNGQYRNITRIVKELSHSCDDMLKVCKFNRIIFPCKSLFKFGIVPGSHGCCLSKNTYIAGHSSGSSIWKAESSGLVTGLYLSLDLEINEYVPQARLPANGAEIMIFDHRSHPFKTSSFGVTSILAAYKEATFVSIDVSVESNNYSIGDDGSVCRRYMRSPTKQMPYSTSECLFRCMMAKLHIPCACSFYQHDFKGEYAECAIRGLECLREQRLKIEAEFDGVDQTPSLMTQCKCPLACDSLLYISTPSSIALDQSSETLNETHVYIFFENPFVNLFVREPIFTAEKLFLQIIGQCSLFFGGSLASIVELIYFITLRLLCELYTNQKPRKEMEKGERRRLDMEEICEGTKEGKIYWNEILANID
ncbi:sodium channel protein Nach-like [Nilaparvata lugens]|uniref:sodium channel protein Nach-like n=1 Tax=Nilaparvata lugens TaxID=108931 RepID=UPI00193DCBE9|nr:sodium channel protein Nach-like [Nilaparvata lugens]